MLSLVLAFIAGVVSQAPTTWIANVTIFYQAGSPGAVSTDAVNIPYLEGSALTVEVLTPTNFTFSLCMKQNVAMPATSNTANWASQCAVNYAFTAPKAGVAAKRAVYSSGALRGVGSEASGASAAVQSAVGVLERRMLGESWSALAPAIVRMGSFYATIIANAVPTGNVSVTLQLSGKTCTVGRYGPACEAPSTIDANVTIVVPTPAAMTSLYTFDGSAINNATQALELSVAKTTPGANMTGTIYLRWQAPPVDAPAGYDAKLTLTGDTATASLATPRPGLWFLLFVADNITALVTNVTLRVPSCPLGKVGAACDTTLGTVGAAGAVTDNGMLASGGQLFYSFVAGSELSLAAAADSSPNVPSLYAKLGGLPTATDYDFAGCNVASCANQVTLKVPTSDVAPALRNEPWYALVVANGDGGVSVWNANGCANNCNGANGVCNAATSTCACADDFSGFDCSTSKSALERWEWALIIGGGVLVAIALIGCIVYFIQKQQRRRGFERV